MKEEKWCDCDESEGHDAGTLPDNSDLIICNKCHGIVMKNGVSKSESIGVRIAKGESMKTNVQDTSLKAYKEIEITLGFKQIQVLYAFNDNKYYTNSELADKLGWSVNTVTPRVFELRAKNRLEKKYKRKCRITGRTAIAWGMPIINKQINLL